MSDDSQRKTDPNPKMVYQIKIEGRLGQQWSEWFGGAAITLEESGVSLLTCTVVDQAALHGLLRKVRDLGMPLLEVRRTDPDSEDTSRSEQ